MRVKASGASLREEGSVFPFQLSFGTKNPERSLGDSQFRVPPPGHQLQGVEGLVVKTEGAFSHQFLGAIKSSGETEAQRDTAQSVLWLEP